MRPTLRGQWILKVYFTWKCILIQLVHDFSPADVVILANYFGAQTRKRRQGQCLGSFQLKE
jgi:hypothetical protein